MIREEDLDPELIQGVLRTGLGDDHVDRPSSAGRGDGSPIGERKLDDAGVRQPEACDRGDCPENENGE